MTSHAGSGFGGSRGSLGGDSHQRTVRGVFVSHASEDVPLADAFRELIQDVSAGLIPTYSSSSRDPASGIAYGDDWFQWIEDRIRESGNVVALITPISVGRPWILFETGFGRAIEGVKVFGLRLGTSGEDAYVGPFKAFQNSGSDPDELLKLCRQLFEGTACQPRDEMLRTLIEQFRSKVDEHFKQVKVSPKRANPESEAVFKALEEMKALVQSRLYAGEWDDMRMMELDHLFETVMNAGRREMDPAVRATMLLGIAKEAGMGWLAPTIEYALDHPIRLDKFIERHLERGMNMRRRRTPFPPEILIRELFRAVQEHQDRRFRRFRENPAEPDDNREEARNT